MFSDVSVAAFTPFDKVPKLDGKEDYLQYRSRIEIFIGMMGARDLITHYDTVEKVPADTVPAWLEKQREVVDLIKVNFHTGILSLFDLDHTVKQVLDRASAHACGGTVLALACICA